MIPLGLTFDWTLTSPSGEVLAQSSNARTLVPSLACVGEGALIRYRGRTVWTEGVDGTASADLDDAAGRCEERASEVPDAELEYTPLVGDQFIFCSSEAVAITRIDVERTYWMDNGRAYSEHGLANAIRSGYLRPIAREVSA